jgi:hypothetical protein
LKIGDRVITTSILNVRATASTAGALLGNQPVGTAGTVISNVVAGSGFYWWSINFDSGVDGWVVEDYLNLSTVSAPQTQPTPPSPTPTPTPVTNRHTSPR